MHIQKIVDILSDYEFYHLNYGHSITQENVNQWLDQFSSETREDFAQAFAKLLEKSYINKNKMLNLIKKIDKKIKIKLNNAPFLYLKIQQNGKSQKDILSLIPQVEQKNFPYNNFVYFDDILYSGGRAQHDIIHWINNYAPQQCYLICYFIAAYGYGKYNTEKKIHEAIKNIRKKISFILHSDCKLKNYKLTSDSHDIFHPNKTCSELEEISEFYNNEKQKAKFPMLRTTITTNSSFFENEKQRCLLEKELTIAGIKILNKISEDKKRYWKPLGLEGFPSFGFGTPIITYRNCPNTAPLALWWGNQFNNNIWYPLVPRETYSI